MSLANRFRCLLSVIGICLPLTLAHAQEPHFRHFRVEDGLPSNEVYGMVFDNNNILWATTDRGVWRYDGYQSRHITVADGLQENSNLRIIKDSRNRIWVTSTNNYISVISGDSVYNHPISRQTHLYGRSSRNIQQLMENSDGSVTLCYNRPGLYRFKEDMPPDTLTNHLAGQQDSSVCIFLNPDGFYWDMLNLPKKNVGFTTRVLPVENRIYITAGVRNEHNSYRKDLHLIHPDEFLFSYDNKAFHIRKGKLKSEISLGHEITDVYADSDGNFWVGTLGEGVYRYKNSSFDSKPIQYLADEHITGITQDMEGGYWFSTNFNGIFQANSLKLAIYTPKKYDSQDNIITAMTTDGKDLYLGTQEGNLYRLRKDTSGIYGFSGIPLMKSTRALRKLNFNTDGNLVIFKDDVLEINPGGKPAGTKFIPGYAHEFVNLPTGDWAVSFESSVNIYKKGRLLRLWDKEHMPEFVTNQGVPVTALNKIKTMFLDSAGNLWLGSLSNGLFSNKGDSLSHWAKKDTLFSRRILDIAQTGPNIWFSVADFGITIIRKDSTLFRITQKEGLSSDIVDVLFPENDSVVWAGTNLGANRITVSADCSSIRSIEHFTMREGLPSNRIFQILKYQGFIWLATTQGAVQISPDFVKPPRTSPVLVFDTTQINGVDRLLANGTILKADENNLFFKYKAISYRTPHNIQYRYFLSGRDTGYSLSPNTELRYTGLPYGDYTFRVNSSYTKTFADPDLTLSFTIRKHWYETRLFLVIITLLIAAIIYQVFLLILRDLQNREKQKQRLLEAEKRSLLSQMNPHFIFNSLNSIQHFIIQNDDLQANNYLTNFSSLIRKILENSKKNLITLSEEISTLTLYLEMEKLRFEEGFEYKINRDLNIDYNEVMIPPMIIQPFVENAIWHGIMPLRTKGLLTITFSRIDGYYHCLIRDNGIGRENAGRLKGKKEPHSSTGMTNINERISLMNRINKKKINMNVTDLKNEDGTAAGTMIEIIIPLFWE